MSSTHKTKTEQVFERMSLADYRRQYIDPTEQVTKPNKYNKYNNNPCEIDGIKFDSVREAERYTQLRLLERAGAIRDLQLQVPYIIIPKSEHGRALKYIADFAYIDHNELYVVEDAKGVQTPVYKLKRRLMAEVHNIIIKEV